MDNIREGMLQSVSRNDFFEVLRNEDNNSRKSSVKPEHTLVNYLKMKFNMHHCSQRMFEELNRITHSFMIGFNKRWKTCHRNKIVFLKKYNDWLNITVTINDLDATSTSGIHSVKKGGRRKLDFSSSGLKSKARKVKPLFTDYTLSELTLATNMKLRQSGKRDAAYMLTQLVSSPKRATKVKKAFHGAAQQTPQYSSDEALALITATKLSYRKYQFIRKSANGKGLKLYPSYEQIKSAKIKCYPLNADCLINDSLAEIKLQSIVDLTIKRLCIVQAEVLNSILVEKMIVPMTLTMIFKWGCDGSGGQSRYKQKTNSNEFEDSNILATSLVPLQLYVLGETNQKNILWQNPRPSSTSYCRPIRFRFAKETEQLVLDEFINVRRQISEILTTLVECNGIILEVKHKFEETMVDGKICNILASNRATQKCYICQATSKDMNNLKIIRRRISDPQTFSWGLSTLHAQIRLMECVLHIAYRLDIQKWQCRTPEDKLKIANRKKLIIEKFRSETGLLLDTPKQGRGNTNDGNSARRFFKNPALAAKITGVDQSQIDRFNVILRTLTCGYEINIPAFTEYCDETATLYISLYNWYPMPVTLHKILLHGPEVIQHFILPIGQMSEEAQESRHKEIRKYRLEYSRKVSRTTTNTDILHNLLISSDPVITSLMPKEKHNVADIHPSVQKLLQSPNIHEQAKEEAQGNCSNASTSEASDSEDSGSGSGGDTV